MLNRSCSWIRDHWDACNLDVPEELLEQWTYQPGESDFEPNGFHVAVFSFGYLQHDLISNRVPVGVKRTLSASLMLELFSRWQLKLALAEIHRGTDLRMHPLPLFSFSNNEEIEFWQIAP